MSSTIRLRSNPAEIARGLELLIPDGAVGEVRIVYAGGTHTEAGYFNDRDAALKAVLQHDGRAIIYATLNPVVPALLARAHNRLVRNLKPLTGDRDILRRRFILCDLDAVRPAGISATDEEHDAALVLAGRVESRVFDFGWPHGTLADSGNGGHVLFRVDEPNDAATTDLVKRCLATISAEFSTDLVKVDVSVFNASRVTKLYGTIAVKGDSTVERPHRPSRLF